MVETKVLFFSRFELDENGGGGRRREAQLAEVLRPLNYRFISYRDSVWFKANISRRDRIMLWVEKKFSPYRFFWRDDYFRDYVFKMRAVSRTWRNHVDAAAGVELVVMDDPIYFYPLVEYLAKKQIPFVGLCQNIESLSYSQVNSDHQLKLFIKEIELLKKCGLVITISREEVYLLKNFNIPAFYLPYYPVKSIEDRMLTVRKRRETTKKKGFLMIGTVGNMVTLDGMTAFIDHWRSEKNRIKNDKLIVAGYLTPLFIKTASCEKIDILGELSNQRLDDILSSVKAMICFQEYGSGALTKIREMLIAGVPVLATPHAARSYHEYDEVMEFSDLDDLERAVSILDNLRKPCNPGPPRKNPIINPSTMNAELVGKIKELIAKQCT